MCHAGCTGFVLVMALQMPDAGSSARSTWLVLEHVPVDGNTPIKDDYQPYDVEFFESWRNIPHPFACWSSTTKP